jgi:hypothetical protein
MLATLLAAISSSDFATKAVIIFANSWSWNG